MAKLLYNLPIMEMMREPSRRRTPDVNNQLGLEKELGVDIDKLIRYTYLPFQNILREANSSDTASSRDQIEVLLHAETATMVVRPFSPRPITIDDLAVMTLPVVRFIEDQLPDVVIGCDRGARIYAIAVHNMWGKLSPGKDKFPTLDGDMHFARLSTSLSLEVSAEALQQILEVSLKEASKNGKKINSHKPKIMFIDDLVASGRTREHIYRSLESLGLLSEIDVAFAIMCGSGGDASGSRDRTEIPWHDNPRVIGVDYDKQGVPAAVRTSEAMQIRKKVHAATDKLASRLT